MISHCYRVFMKRATYIEQNVKTTEKFGGSNIFATLSGTHLLIYNNIIFIYRPRGRVKIGLS